MALDAILRGLKNASSFGRKVMTFNFKIVQYILPLPLFHELLKGGAVGVNRGGHVTSRF